MYIGFVDYRYVYNYVMLLFKFYVNFGWKDINVL